MCSDAPDTSGINQAAVMNADLAREMAEIGRAEIAMSRERQAQFDPKFLRLIESSIASQAQQDGRSQAQWDAYLSDFRPAEQALARRSLDYDTAGRRDAAEADARARVATEGAMAREAQGRSLNRAGINLSSGRALTLDRASRLTEAKNAVGAGIGARRQIEATGLSLLDNVTKTGRGLASTGLQAAQLALGAGGQASGQLGQQQAAYNASLAPGMGAFGGASSAASASGNSYAQIAGIQQQAQSNDMAGLAGLGSLAGMIGSAGTGSIAGSLLLSSRDAKDDLGGVDPEAALASVVNTPVKAWRYKGDEQVRVGPMAEDVQESTGLGDGKTLDVATELGTLRGAVQALAARVDKPAGKRRRSLADVQDVAYTERA